MMYKVRRKYGTETVIFPLEVAGNGREVGLWLEFNGIFELEVKISG